MKALALLAGFAAAALAVIPASVGVVLASAGDGPPDAEALLTRVSARVAEYHRRAHSVIFMEESTVQPIGSNLSPAGSPRTVQSEVRVESRSSDGRPLAEAQVIRKILRVNGRAPREQDRTHRSGCTDPNPLSPEPLAFLLPERRREFRFTSPRTGKESGRRALIVDFASVDRTSRPVLIEDPLGHDDCFDWIGPLAATGRIWVDADSHDVLRVDRHVSGPVDISVAPPLQMRHGLGAWVVLDRDDQSLRYRPVAFREPEEVILLPAAVESVTALRGGLQSIRRTQRFSGYRRFLTAGRVVRLP